VVTGRIPSEPLGRVMTDRVGLPVEVWDPLSRLAIKGRRLRRRLERSPGLGPLLAASLGLALRRN